MSSDRTIAFYEECANSLLERYEMAGMDDLHHLLLGEIKLGGNVVDIGFGSGRDLHFLLNQGYNVWGIDPSAPFVEHAKKRFAAISGHIICDQIPFKYDHRELHGLMDAVIIIAVWMHLDIVDYGRAVDDVVSLLKPEAKVIVSYSRGNRDVADGRTFNDVDQSLLDKLFANHGFMNLDAMTTEDSLERNSLTWVTVVYAR